MLLLRNEETNEFKNINTFYYQVFSLYKKEMVKFTNVLLMRINRVEMNVNLLLIDSYIMIILEDKETELLIYTILYI